MAVLRRRSDRPRGPHGRHRHRIPRRGLGIFRTLTLAILDRHADEIDLVFNTPNAASRPGYLKMGWSAVGTVPIAIRPVHPIRLARGARGARSAAPDGAVPPIACPHPPVATVLADPRLPGLLGELAAAESPGRLRTVRSLDYLRWRYSTDSGLDYRAIRLEQGGRLRGVAIGRPRVRGSLTEFTLRRGPQRSGRPSGAPSNCCLLPLARAPITSPRICTGIGWATGVTGCPDT